MMGRRSGRKQRPGAGWGSRGGQGRSRGSRGGWNGAEMREVCWVLDRLLQKRRFLREACRILDRLLHLATG